MRQLKVKVADCSYDKLVTVAKRAGFKIVGGKKHCKVKTRDGKYSVTEIIRKNRIKRESARSIVEDLNRFGANIEIS